MKNLLKRKCPVCNSDNSAKEIGSRKNASTSNYEDLKECWNGLFKEKIIFNYNRCINCGTLYCPTFFNNDHLAELYNQMPANMDEVPLSALIKTQGGYFNFLKKNSTLSGDFMEVGPDIGLFTDFAVKKGNYNKFWLFEPNIGVKDALQSVVSSKKFSIIHKMEDFSEVKDNSIDTIVIIHVMDHLLDPLPYLKSIKKKLKSDGSLLIVTHNEKSLLRYIFKGKWPAFCLQHPQLYNLKTTSKLLSQAGFECVDQGRTRNYFKISFLIKHVLWAIGLKIKYIPDFFGLTLGLKLGNIITIAKQKKD
tara:strand:+ start:37 stop:954 length:918 start_codon:yes stop_codon:yes gene_type:complete